MNNEPRGVDQERSTASTTDAVESPSRDTERMEWLERNALRVWVLDPPSGDAWQWFVEYSENKDDQDEEANMVGSPDHTLRAGIDAAMAALAALKPADGVSVLAVDRSWSIPAGGAL